MKNSFKIKIGSLSRELPLIKTDTISYYSFNVLGDATMNEEAGKQISDYIHGCNAIVTVESKAIALAQVVSRLLGIERYVVIRKTKKSYMRNVISTAGETIISGATRYYLDGEDVDYLQGKKVAFIDDVISTGGTIKSVINLLKRRDITIAAIGCVLCEGKMHEEIENIPVHSCGFLPLPEDRL